MRRISGLVKTALLVLLAVVLLAGAGLAGVYLYLNPSPPASQAFINGHVLTMNAGFEIAEAVYVRGARIERVGSNEDIATLINSSTVVHDLRGHTLLPGFIDAHGHFPGSGLAAVAADLNSPPIGGVENMSDLQSRLRQRLPDIPEGRWLLGYGYDDTLLAEQRHPHHADLDLVSKQIPILVMHVSGHMGVVNSAGLAVLGIDRNSADPDGGEIHRDAEGEADGLLLETAFNPVRELALEFGAKQQYALLTHAIADYLRHGVTTVQNGLALAKHGKSLSLASKLGLIPQRLLLWPDVTFARQLLSGEIEEASLKSDRLTVGAVKIQADGSIQGYTGFLTEPYHVPQKSGDRRARGYPTLVPQQLDALVKEFHGAGKQLAIHANGDAAIDLVINAFRRAQAEYPVADPRLVLVHAQMLRPDQFGELNRLGITPSFFNAHVYYWGDRHRDIFLGPERASRISPLHSAGEAGLRYSLHLDTPVVPMQPMRMLHAAVTRQTSSGKVLGSSERIAAMQALAAMTIDAAWQVFEAGNRGSIEPGKWADLVVLNGDPLGDSEQLLSIAVQRTVIGGVTVYSRQ